jgi:hypothetical protein
MRNNMARGEKFIFVGGAARSGTTMFQNILDSHPDIIGGPQFRNIPDIIALRKKLHYSINIGKTKIFNSCDDIDNYICTFIESLLLPLLNKSNCRLLSEKTPPNIFVFPELMELFPEAHYIYVIRDPRAVISSNKVARSNFKEKGLAFFDFSSTRLADFIALTKWVKEFYVAGQDVTTREPERVITVVYERLVHSPESETRKICKFLGIEWSPQMLHPSRETRTGEEGTTCARASWHTKEGTFDRDIDTTSIDKWEKDLNCIQRSIISYFFRDVEGLSHYDYDLAPTDWREKFLSKSFLNYQKLVKKMRVLSLLSKPLKKLRIGSSTT